jgi:hypothetical protein
MRQGSSQPITEIVDGLISHINNNLIAQSNLVSNALTGNIMINVENSFHFEEDQEIVLLDYGYNNPTSPHYQIFEYAVIKAINTSTNVITLEEPIVDPNGGWMVSEHAFIQKTIGHSPLYTDRIYYGDREVIPTEEMAVTVEPVSMSNEWIYLMGGLSKEYRVSVIVYGKDIETQEGMIILNKYADALFDLFMSTLHIAIKNNYTPVMANVVSGTSTVIIEDTPENNEYFVLSSTIGHPSKYIFQIQDNLHVDKDLSILNIAHGVPVLGQMTLTVGDATGSPHIFPFDFLTQQFAVFMRFNRYFYDSRIDSVEYGVVQKGSAFIRAARLNWFGKEVEEFSFPQQDTNVPYLPKVGP